MDKSVYKVENKFECCGKHMVIVIIDGKAACIMSELEYNMLIKTEQKCNKENSLKVA